MFTSKNRKHSCLSYFPMFALGGIPILGRHINIVNDIYLWQLLIERTFCIHSDHKHSVFNLEMSIEDDTVAQDDGSRRS